MEERQRSFYSYTNQTNPNLKETRNIKTTDNAEEFQPQKPHNTSSEKPNYGPPPPKEEYFKSEGSNEKPYSHSKSTKTRKLYEILEISPDASTTEIRTQYK